MSEIALHPRVAEAIDARLAPIGATVDEAVATVVANGARTAQALALLVEAQATIAEAIVDLSRRLRVLEAAGVPAEGSICVHPPDG